MAHRSLSLLACFCALSIIGCSKPGVTAADKDGNTVTVDGNRSVSVQGKDGTNATVQTDNNGSMHMEGTDKDGIKVQETVDKGGITMSNSKGESMHQGAGSVTEDDLGLPFYPGSQESKSGLSMVATDQNGKTAMSYRTTGDDPQKVIDFYKDKITKPSTSSSNVDGSVMDAVSGQLSGDREVAVIVQKKGAEDATIMVTVNPKKH